MNRYLNILPEVAEAIEAKRPIIALESTILSHGMPYPQNLAFAKKVDEIAREMGVVPATIAIIDGKLKVGLTEDELFTMCQAKSVAKVSRRDLPIILATKETGATTVASTMIIADLAGIKVFATGGIGGVHRGAPQSFDISADLQELAHTSVGVVCAGAKSILDIGLTLEYLETMGVPVIGYQTTDFPAFYSRRSGFGVDYKADDAAAVADILKKKWDLGLTGGVVIANPVPAEYEMPFRDMEQVTHQALDAANRAGIYGKKLTPFLLSYMKDQTDGATLNTNEQLAYNNVKVACAVAIEYCK